MLLLQQNLQPYNVSATQAGSWSVANFATGSQAGSWSVAGVMFASGMQAGAWSVANFATGTQAASWSVANFATGSTSGAWSVANYASAAQAGSWSIVSYANATQASAWSVAGFAIGDQPGAWSISAYVEGTQAGAWSVGVSAEVESSGGGGIYPGYSSERKQAETEASKPGSVQAVVAKPQAVKADMGIPISEVSAKQTDGQALRRITNAALREKQLQALGQLMLGLQASQAHREAEQLKQLRLQINNDDALMALLLTL